MLTRTEVRALLGQLAGVSWLVAALLYRAGLRLLECLELRVKDIDHEQRRITIRQGKGRIACELLAGIHGRPADYSWDDRM